MNKHAPLCRWEHQHQERGRHGEYIWINSQLQEAEIVAADGSAWHGQMNAQSWRPESFFIAQELHLKPDLTLYSTTIYTREAILHPDKWRGAGDDLLVRNECCTSEKSGGAKGKNNVNPIFWPGIPLWSMFLPLKWPRYSPLTHECIAVWGIG